MRGDRNPFSLAGRCHGGLAASFLLLLLLLPLCLRCAAEPQPAQLTGLLSNARSLRVAVLLNCNSPLLPSLPYAYPVPSGFNITQCDMGMGVFGDWMRAYVTFDRVVREMGGIPSATGFNASLELIYFQLGPINFLNPNATQVVAQYTAAVQNAYVLAQQLGAFGGFNPAGNGGNGSWDAPCPHCPAPTAYVQPGMWGRFSVLVSPPFADIIPSGAPSPTPNSLSDVFFTACQLSKACIVIASYSGTENWMTCKSQPQVVDAAGTIADIVPPVCLKAVDSTLLADKRFNQRKFDMGFSALPSQTTILAQQLPWFVNKGLRTAVWFISGNSDYQRGLKSTGMAQIRALQVRLLFPVVDFALDGSGLTPAQVESWADRVVEADPEMYICIAATNNPFEVAASLALFRALRARNWSPKAVLMPGGSELQVSAALNADRPGDGDFIYGSTFQSVLLRSSSYDSSRDSLVQTWEPFPSTSDGKLSPMVWLDQYCADWCGSDPTVREAILRGYTVPQILTQMLLLITKMFYFAGTDDPRLMQSASVSLSIPSMAGLLQFDAYGRLAGSDQFVTQQIGGVARMITPQDIGVPEVFPFPTWQERIPPTQGSASFQGLAVEKHAVGWTAVVVAYLLALLALVALFRNNPVMKSSSPTFCAIMILGAILLACSNFGLSLYAVEEGCAADAWLLTTGFTVMMAALLSKVWRVYKIFHSRKLNVVSISNRSLFLVVGLCALVDLVVNAAWQAVAGFGVQYVVVDHYRPVYDYVQCNYSDASKVFIYVHLVLKSGLLLAGMVLTVLARNLPSTFNETPYLAASMYNAAILLVFCIPLVASGVGGRETTYLIRVYGLLAIVLSTTSILFVPKLIRIRASSLGVKPGDAAVGAPKMELVQNVPTYNGPVRVADSARDAVSVVPDLAVRRAGPNYMASNSQAVVTPRHYPVTASSWQLNAPPPSAVPLADVTPVVATSSTGSDTDGHDPTNSSPRPGSAGATVRTLRMQLHAAHVALAAAEGELAQLRPLRATAVGSAARPAQAHMALPGVMELDENGSAANSAL